MSTDQELGRGQDRQRRANWEDLTSPPPEKLELPKELDSSNLIPAPLERYQGKFDLAHMTLEAIFVRLELEGHLPDPAMYSDAIAQVVEETYEEIFEMMDKDLEE